MSSKKQKNDAKTLDERFLDELVRIAWMGISGRSEDLRKYLERLTPDWKDKYPILAERVSQLLDQHESSGLTRRALPPTGGIGDISSPMLASESMASDLLRIEANPHIPIEPVWPEGVEDSLSTIVKERLMIGRLTDAGMVPTKTVIFTGPPGVGKTLAARWVARELHIPLCILSLGAVMSSFLGRTGANLRQVMSYAVQHPCVLFLDEIDAIAKKRDDSSDVGELKRLVTVLLQELDAWPSSTLLIAATNHEQLLDPAVWRRFEQRVEFGNPTTDQQFLLLQRVAGEQWNALSRNLKLALGVVIEGLSPSDITQLAHKSKRDALLTESSFADRFVLNAQALVRTLPLSERRVLGQRLKLRGIGQREIHRMTGLARETIRELES